MAAPGVRETPPIRLFIMENVSEFAGRVDREQIRAFITRSIPEQVHLVAIGQNGAIQGRYFGTNYEAAVTWAAQQNQVGENIYFSPHLVRAGLHKQPQKMDVTTPRLVSVDIDPPKSRGPFDKEGVLRRLASDNTPPSFVVDSGNGLQAFYRVDAGSLEQCEFVVQGLIHQFGGDRGTHNFNRVMHLPGTVNWPTEAKKRRGYVPRLATVACPDQGIIYLMSDLLSAFGSGEQREASPAADISLGEIELIDADDLQLGPDDYLRKLIEDPQNIDRSVNVFAFVCEALKARLTHEQIAGVLLNPENAVSEHCLTQMDPERSVRRAIANATAELSLEAANPISHTNFWWVAPQGEALFMLTRELWPAASVTGALGKIEGFAAAEWLRKNKLAAQMIWAPGEPSIIEDKLMNGGSWTSVPGAKAINTYLPPQIPAGGDAAEAGPWLKLIERLYPQDARHLLKCFAHRVQHPNVKLNHAAVLGGGQGIGKDSLLEPLKVAIGPQNWADISPSQAMGRFNAFLKSVVLRISEAHDLGDKDRYTFYDRTKTWICAPPDVHMIDEKNRREYQAQNVTFVIITTNRQDSLHLEADGRRHFVAWSHVTKEDFEEGYWPRYWGWLQNQNGYAHVAAYLAELDLTDFDPKAEPPKTAAFMTIMYAGQPTETGQLNDVLENLGWPNAVTIDQLAAEAESEFRCWLKQPSNAKRLAHRLNDCGYQEARNPDRKDGRWKINGSPMKIYGPQKLPEHERVQAARALCTAKPKDKGSAVHGVHDPESFFGISVSFDDYFSEEEI